MRKSTVHMNTNEFSEDVA